MKLILPEFNHKVTGSVRDMIAGFDGKQRDRDGWPNTSIVNAWFAEDKQQPTISVRAFDRIMMLPHPNDPGAALKFWLERKKDDPVTFIDPFFTHIRNPKRDDFRRFQFSRLEGYVNDDGAVSYQIKGMTISVPTEVAGVYASIYLTHYVINYDGSVSHSSPAMVSLTDHDNRGEALSVAISSIPHLCDMDVLDFTKDTLFDPQDVALIWGSW